MDSVLLTLRAVAEPTRLRILNLCARVELTVSDLSRILGQSQPRVSRHLKLMVEAQVLERNREGSFVYYRAEPSDARAGIARAVLDLLRAEGGTVRLDRQRLETLVAERTEQVRGTLAEHARRWAEIRPLYVNEEEVDRVLVRLFPSGRYESLLDVGTGTGRMLELLGPSVERAVGIDTSREMLALARANVTAAGLPHCQVRQADMYRLPIVERSFDAVVLHMVLQYSLEPARALAEAGRVLRPGGRLAIVDFAPHDEESLRTRYRHAWTGFADEDVRGWLSAAGLAPEPTTHLPGEPITVSVWPAALREAPTGRSTAP